MLAAAEPPFEEYGPGWKGVWYSKWLMLGGVPTQADRIRQ